MITYFDSHCHVDEPQFDEDREAVLQRMAEAGVRRYAVIGSDMPSSRRCADYAAAHPGCVAVIGIHPHEASSFREGDLDTLAAWTKEEKVVAIGEIGLDYHYDFSPRDQQKQVLLAQLELAHQLDLPVAFHIREAHQEMLNLFKANKSLLTGGIIHCFSGSWDIAKEYLKLGYHISFAGPLTFKKAPKLVDAAAQIPLDRLLIETDSPYLSPEPLRGRRNEPTNVLYVCAKLAEIRGMTEAAMAEQTLRNAMQVYRLTEEA